MASQERQQSREGQGKGNWRDVLPLGNVSEASEPIYEEGGVWVVVNVGSRGYILQGNGRQRLERRLVKPERSFPPKISSRS